MQSAYKAELERLTREGIIAEVHQHTEWINSIVPVVKSDGSLRLCLDPKDLNQAIERNQWYSRTLDDILPELSQSKYFTLDDATSGYWHIPLDLQSSLLTTFNTPWGKFRWLRLPFGLKVASDVFQERLDKVLRLLDRSPWNCRWHPNTWKDWDWARCKTAHSIWDCKTEQHNSQPKENAVQVYRLQVLWSQTNRQRSQSRSGKDWKP